MMLSPHNSISKKFLLHFDYVYRISLVQGKMQSRSQCVCVGHGRALQHFLPRVLHFPGSGKHLPRPSGRKPGSPLLVSKVQPPCRPPTTDVLRPVQEGEENTREQRWCSLRPAGCWEGTGLPPMFLPRSHGHRTGPVKYRINNFILNIHLNVFVFVCVDHTVPCKFYLSCKFEYFAGNSKNE